MDAIVGHFVETEKLVALPQPKVPREISSTARARLGLAATREELAISGQWEHAAWILLGAASAVAIVLSFVA